MAKPATKSTALWVLRRLRAAGHEALLAGGCVRDMLLGRRSCDYDVATDATPQEVKKLFRHVLLIGAKFGVAMVLHRGRKVEVAPFRSDLSYSDGRRPDGVRFTTAREDARRRDFTINGMFYDPAREKVIDYVGGRRDLKRGLIRTIGNPRERFAEDYLRMLRAGRFAVQLGFRIAPATAAAARKLAPKIASISGERIFDELSKMLSTDTAAQSLRLLDELRLAREVLPELFAEPGDWRQAVKRVESVAARRDLVLTLGALLSGFDGKTIRRIIRRWGASNELGDGVCLLASHRGQWREAADMPLCDFKRLMAGKHFQRLRTLWSAAEREETQRSVFARRIARRAAAIPKGNVAPVPFVSGDDLAAMGLKEGPSMGQILRKLYDAQLDEEITSRRRALATARKLISE